MTSVSLGSILFLTTTFYAQNKPGGNKLERLAYSVKEFAAATGLKSRHIYLMKAEGKLRTINVGKRILIPADEAKRLLQA